MFDLTSLSWEFFLFFVTGLIFGRGGAFLTEIYCNPKKIQKGVLSFFLQCQNHWGWLPFAYPARKIQAQNPPPVRPFIMELIMSILFVFLFYYIGWKWVLLEYLIFTFALIIASAVDVEQMILPDSLTLSGIGLGLIGAFLNPEVGREFWPALAGMLMGGGFLLIIAIFYTLLRKEEGLGGGDIKLLAWIGAVLTWKAIPAVIFLSCVTGLLAGLIMVFRSKAFWSKPTQALLGKTIPFGPYLAFSALIYIFFKDQMEPYLSLFYL